MAVTKTILDEWKERIDTFNTNVDKTLDVIRESKNEIEQMKVDILNEIHNGQYIRDDECIVISAPKIIIGNVNKDGNLRNGASGEIIIRGKTLQLDGVGENGSLKMRATRIEQSAVDPGIDGKEVVVQTVSRIVSQAKSIFLDSQCPAPENPYKGVFLNPPNGMGIKIHSHYGIEVIASPQSANRKKKATARKNKLDAEALAKQAVIKTKQQEIKTKLDNLKNIINQNEKLNQNDQDLTKSNILALEELAVLLKAELPIINQKLIEYASDVSELAEMKRKSKAFQAIIDDTNAKANAYKASTMKKLLLQSEKIEIHSKDGDGQWRTNPEAGVDIRANNIKLRATQEATDGTYAEVLTPPEAKGRVDIHARNVSVSTADLTDYTCEKNKLEKGKFPLMGDVTIRSKTINMESVNLEQTDASGKLKETGLTEKGEINLRANKVKVKTINEKGEAVGGFNVNSKKISLKSNNISDYPAESALDEQGNRQKQSTKGKEKKLTVGSAMLLMSETIHVGKKDDKTISKDVYVTSTNTMSVSGKNSLLAAEGVQLNMPSNKVELIAGNNPIDIAGKAVEVSGESTFKGPLTADDVKAKNAQIQGELKTMFMGDGNKVPTTTPQAKKCEKADVPNSLAEGDDMDE